MTADFLIDEIAPFSSIRTVTVIFRLGTVEPNTAAEATGDGDTPLSQANVTCGVNLDGDNAGVRIQVKCGAS